MADIAAIAERFRALEPFLDEGTRRLVEATESRTAGKGGISAVARATGISRPVIRQGLAELKDPSSLIPGGIRRRGGRKKVVEKDTSVPTCRACWNRRRGAIRRRRCAGHARACAN